MHEKLMNFFVCFMSCFDIIKREISLICVQNVNFTSFHGTLNTCIILFSIYVIFESKHELKYIYWCFSRKHILIRIFWYCTHWSYIGRLFVVLIKGSNRCGAFKYKSKINLPWFKSRQISDALQGFLMCQCL